MPSELSATRRRQLLAGPSKIHIQVGEAVLPQRLPKEMLLHLSRKAQDLLKPLRPGSSRTPTTILKFSSDEIDIVALNAVIKWMFAWCNADKTVPMLTYKNTANETFAETVCLYQAVRALDIPAYFTGADLPKRIKEWIAMAPLTKEEFVMIIGRLQGDESVVRKALHNTAYHKIRATLPEASAIVDFVREAGNEKLLEQMKQLEDFVLAKRDGTTT
ncbi:hypothetical protein B0A49_00660 [Cryomyces minteri]|uniref:BTB domain-containing protein n=1 Tax=Cryomyces minteri TaxID=331657 RepID=A0A4U0XXM3_9PEZI|nr:hypothetical protein B0A49_00660 [Cryomyces minteri]